MSSRAERRRKQRARAKAGAGGGGTTGGKGGERVGAKAGGTGGGKRGGGGLEHGGRGGTRADRSGDAVSAPERLPAVRVLMLAAALALVAGAIEVAVVVFAKRQGLIVRLSEHFAWMIPAAHLLTFLVVAVLLLALRRVWPRAGTPGVSIGVLMGLLVLAVVGILEPLYTVAVAVLAVGVGVQAGRMARGRFGRALIRAAPIVTAVIGPAFLAALVGSFVAPRRAESRALAAVVPAEGHPNILLVVMDAVRAQSMGLYNRDLANTPVLSALAGQSVVFDRATSPSPWTLPSHATLFTGRWPTEHLADWHRALDGRYPTLAERFTDAGYATAGFTANLAFTGAENGIARGFAHYEAYPLSLGQLALSTSLGRRLANDETPRRWLGLNQTWNEVPAPEVTGRFLRWRNRHRDRPFFVFMNYYDAHEPFPPAPGGPPITPLTHRHSLFSGTVTHFEAPEPTGEDRFLRGYLAGYQAAIGTIDQELLRLLRALDRNGDLASTIVVITSDHGEVIGEHRLVGHNSSLYYPNLWVPLLIRYPASVPAGVRVRQEVTLRHLPATLLDLAGVPNDSALPGRSLAALWSDPGALWPDTLYAHLTGGSDFPPWAPAARGPEMHSLIRDAHHYILNGDGSEELYRLDGDPGELRNLADSASTPTLEQLRAVLRSVPGVEHLPGDPPGGAPTGG